MTSRPDEPSTHRGPDPDPDPDGPPPFDGPDTIESEAERLAGALAEDWRAGRRRRVEDVLESHPEIRDHPRAAVRLIYEEICLRQDEGPEASEVEVLGRFPRYREELRLLLAGHHLLEDEAATPAFPKAGETLGGNRLLAELGRGAMGRVFLASQPGLADRPVVLKLVPRRGSEHVALARLQHAHIVPLYKVDDFPDLGLRSLCMPYHGSLTLARLEEALGTIPTARRTGTDILEALDRSHEGLPVELPAMGPARAWLARASHAEALAWVGGCLARALQHAHERGLIHLDIKPTNILLAADGQPMLLDFHLARKPIHPDDPDPGSIGGTPLYLSPEQAETLQRARAGRGPRSVVDGRSDLYSLGLVLYQALGGPWPPPPTPREARRSLRRANRAVSAGLADVVARCLEREPGDRYPDAGALAEDLRLHLADRPLKGVGNRSPVERWRKWRRRRPHALAVVAMALVVATAAAIVAFAAWKTRTPRPVEAIEAVLLPAPGGRAEAADRLARVVGRLRAEVAPGRRLDPALAIELAGLCREIWDGSQQLLDAGAGPLPVAAERRVRADLVDLVVLSIQLEARANPEDPAGARRLGLRRLDEAATRFGPSPALDRAREDLLDRHSPTKSPPSPATRRPGPKRDRPDTGKTKPTPSGAAERTQGTAESTERTQDAPDQTSPTTKRTQRSG